MTRPTLRPEHLWLAVWAAALALVLLAAGAYVVGKHRWASAKLDEIEPRYARLAGLQGSQAALTTLATRLRTDARRLIYPADTNLDQTANAVLQSLRDAASASQLNVTTSQVLAVREQDGFDRQGFSMSCEGTQAAVAQWLGALAARSPLVYVDNLQLVQRGLDAAGAPIVVASANLYILKARP